MSALAKFNALGVFALMTSLVTCVAMSQQADLRSGVMRLQDGPMNVTGRLNSLADKPDCWVILLEDDHFMSVMELDGLPPELRIEGLRVSAIVQTEWIEPGAGCTVAPMRLRVVEARPSE